MGALLALLICAIADPTAAQSVSGPSEEGELHFLAVGVCPPYRKLIPVEVCRKSVDRVVTNIKENLSIDPDNITILLDEKSTGPNFLATMEDYRKKLSSNDRLMVYLLLHGDAFDLWQSYYKPTGAVEQINRGFVRPEEDIMVFWTRNEPSVPALALAEKHWLTASEIAQALDSLDAQVGLILDSCSSGLYFQRLTDRALGADNIDFVLTSAGTEQFSNFDPDVHISLFAREFGAAIDLPYVRTLGQAIEHARMTTVLHAAAQCTDFLIDGDAFRLLFPHLPVPNVQTSDGKVTPAQWACVQVPNVVDLSGKVSALQIN